MYIDIQKLTSRVTWMTDLRSGLPESEAVAWK